MKNLFMLITVYIILLFSVFSIMFFAGCQENNITEPLTTELATTQAVTNVAVDKTKPGEPKENPNIITFQQIITLYYSPNAYLVAKGTIEVKHQVQISLSEQPFATHKVNVDLQVNAELFDMENNRNRWFISELTQKTFRLIKGEPVTFVQYYNVEGRDDHLHLALTFQVDLEQVTLLEISSYFPRQHSAGTVAQ